MGSLHDDMMEDHANKMRGKNQPTKNQPTKKYRVFISQINQTFIEVDAADEEEASIKGYAKWRRDCAQTTSQIAKTNYE